MALICKKFNRVKLNHKFQLYKIYSLRISSYALKHPQYTKALMLIDPWGFPVKPINTLAKCDTPTPIWIKFVTNVSSYISRLSLFRATGPLGMSLFKYLRPDFKKKYTSILGNTDLIYEYLYNCNKQYPR